MKGPDARQQGNQALIPSQNHSLQVDPLCEDREIITASLVSRRPVQIILVIFESTN